MSYKCKDCKNNATAVCSVCSNYMGVPDRWEPKPRTNADRIRAMTDEELAEELCLGCCQESREDCNKYIIENSGGGRNCLQHWLDWLRQEADE